MIRNIVLLALAITLTIQVQSAVRGQSLDDKALGFRREVPANRGLDANLYIQTSAEYRAACYQAYQLAALRLQESLEAHAKATSSTSAAANGMGPSKLAVVMDLDETVLDNSGFQSWMLRSNLAYDQRWFDRWEQYCGHLVGLVPGAKEFILDAERQGVAVIHISNRNERFRVQTRNVLKRLGIPIHDDFQLQLSSTTSDKTSRRQVVEGSGKYKVVLYVGDNLRDFDESFRASNLTADSTEADVVASIDRRKQVVDDKRANFGSHWILLPNPAYGEWTKPLGRGNEDFNRLTGNSTEIGFAFWNVENLFDVIDDPHVIGDEEFTPEGPNAWTAERLEIKLTNLSRVIQAMHGGKGPAILGLAEIENRAVLEMLVKKLEPIGRHYQIVHQDSPSSRGIDCVLLYDANLFELSGARFHAIDAEDTRDVLEARLTRDGHALTVFINHWPSRAHDPSFRMTAATTLRQRVDELLASDPRADLIIAGDLNDFPSDPSVREGLKTTGDPAMVDAKTLFNTSESMDNSPVPGSYVYDEMWQILDHVIVSPGLLLPGDASWGIGSTQSAILTTDQLFDPSGPGIPRPGRSYSKTTFHADGYSDHLPVVSTLYWD